MRLALPTTLLAALGFLAPAASASEDVIVHSGGTIIVHDSVKLNSGDFKVEAGGAVAIDLGGKVTASGAANYGGTLTVAPAGGGTLEDGKTYTLFSAASYLGAFSTVNLPPLTPPLMWSSSNLGVNGTLSIFASNPPPTTITTVNGGNNTVINGTNTFSVNDPNAMWNFGDGTTATGGTVTHIFTIPGTYQVTVTTLDANGNKLTQTISITVAATPFRVTRSRFTLAAAGDKATLKGLVHIDQALAQTVVVNVGGNIRTFTLDAKGRAKTGGDTLIVKAPKKGRKASDTSLTLTLKGSLAAALKANSPLDAAGFPTRIDILLQINGSYVGTTLNVAFKNKPSGATAATK